MAEASQVIEIAFPNPPVALAATIQPFMYHAHHLIIELLQHPAIALYGFIGKLPIWTAVLVAMFASRDDSSI
jgi:hypothetical protein